MRGRSLAELGRTLSWWDLDCLLEQLRADPSSAFCRAVDPDAPFRQPVPLLLIKIVDELRTARPGAPSLWDQIFGPPDGSGPVVHDPPVAKTASQIRAEREARLAAARAAKTE